MNELEKKLKQFLNFLWLRPESALIATFKAKSMQGIRFVHPSLDISCGDGFSLFVALGGEIDNSHDRYMSTRAKDFKHESFIDIYDSYDENYEIKVTKEPCTIVGYGTDWKQPLLDRAEKLGVYRYLFLHDNNKIPLPFPSHHFRTIYSNSIYWVKDVKSLACDIHRMLDHEGEAVLHVITPFMLDTLKRAEKYLSREAIDILDRNRRATMFCQYSYKEWRALFVDCDFVIKDVKSVYPNQLIMDIWNIGLRPISHLLIQMVNNLSVEDRMSIKAEWVEIFFELLRPLLDIESNYELENAPYLMYRLGVWNEHLL